MKRKVWWNEGQVLKLPSSRIIPGENDRTVFDQTGLEELAASIAEHGLAQPVTVRPIPDPNTPEDHWDEWGDCLICGEAGRCQCEWLFQIVAGERRFRAMTTVLDKTEIPCIIRELSDQEASAIMLAENISRRDLDPVDEALAYKKRMDQFQWDLSVISERCGVSRERISKRMKLLAVREDILHLVRKGQFPIGHAELLSQLDHNRQMIAARPLIEGQPITLRQFKGLVDQLLTEQQQDNLFDLALFSGEQAASQQAVTTRKASFPIAHDLPAVRIPEQHHVGAILLAYIEDLEAAGLWREAAVTGAILENLDKLNFARIPVQVVR